MLFIYTLFTLFFSCLSIILYTHPPGMGHTGIELILPLILFTVNVFVFVVVKLASIELKPNSITLYKFYWVWWIGTTFYSFILYDQQEFIKYIFM